MFGRFGPRGCGHQILKLRKTGWQQPSESSREFVHRFGQVQRSKQTLVHARQRSFTRKLYPHGDDLRLVLSAIERPLLTF